MIWIWKKGEDTLYENIFEQLAKNKVDYLLIGGLAVALYGIPRTTGDIDLMVNLNPENLLKLIKTMGQLGFIPKAPVKAEDLADPAKRADWIKNKNMKVFTFYRPDNPYALVDIMIDNPLNYEELARGKKQVSDRGAKIFLIPKKMLIKLKELSGRKQDLSDIKALLESGD
ncbi:hypothetical protein A2625_06315 [candidate division WOR-1 bacterium RIFCSPHIGHO2_01_FULL_53_15]|uniref:Uncharacterized protein n=1 Tax=candidate division WOR-1 bacterium RIFCSPHIGHO2_01_FULL_53_15 TaxID=1802564 RepID=A0A1F4Q1H0_UNCSA|nr:MAG: hypothetical protein A2625_06315 [candidate division WOR-1 bacterium RIFCSPHIGHO2_01_FULL_53_15]OGC13803.1 MAG: hypothetical protein A3D23_01910 [candidate division WOR-1 bacterium RIFCSPHIGHO2_02_FULL_53_26]